jgi:hypothetical protein
VESTPGVPGQKFQQDDKVDTHAKKKYQAGNGKTSVPDAMVKARYWQCSQGIDKVCIETSNNSFKSHETSHGLLFPKKVAKDLINNRSVAGRTRHIDVCYLILREMKETNLLKIKWLKSENDPSNIFTKNLSTYVFKEYSGVFCGE